MGSVLITRIGRGRTMAEAFKDVQETDEHEHGKDPYNGAMNHCDFYGDKTATCPNEDKLVNFVQTAGSKREAYGIVLKKPVVNTNKVKSQVINTPQKGTRKWETVYQAENWLGDVILTASSQTECIKKARAWVEKNPEHSLRITIAKKLTEGNKICAEVKYKPAQGEKMGTYLFAAWAPY